MSAEPEGLEHHTTMGDLGNYGKEILIGSMIADPLVHAWRETPTFKRMFSKGGLGVTANSLKRGFGTKAGLGRLADLSVKGLKWFGKYAPLLGLGLGVPLTALSAYLTQRDLGERGIDVGYWDVLKHVMAARGREFGDTMSEEGGVTGAATNLGKAWFLDPLGAGVYGLQSLMSGGDEEKTASWKTNVGLGLGAAGALAAPSVVSHLAGESVAAQPNIDDERISQMLDDSGVDVGVMHFPSVLNSSAALVPPKGAESALKDLEETRGDYHPATHAAIVRRLKDMIRFSGEDGLVLTGAHGRRLGALAHELGHAKALSKDSDPLDRLAHEAALSAPGQRVEEVVGPIAGFGAGALKGNPLVGALVGAGTGLLSSAPRLYSEYRANELGRELMTDDENAKISYVPTLSSYVAQAALPATAAGLVGALAHKLIARR